MGAFWSLKLLPMVPNVIFSGYGFVPLLPYLERERSPLCGKNSLEFGILQHLRSEWASSKARSGPLRKLLTVVSRIPLLWLHLPPSGVMIDFIRTRSCILPSSAYSPGCSCSSVWMDDLGLELCLLVLALIPQHRRQVVHARQCVRMLFVEEFAGNYILGVHCADPSDVVVLRFRRREHS
jgi:hypothetical protein